MRSLVHVQMFQRRVLVVSCGILGESVMVRSLCLSVVLVLEFSDRGISQIGSRPDVSIKKTS